MFAFLPMNAAPPSPPSQVETPAPVSRPDFKTAKRTRTAKHKLVDKDSIEAKQGKRRRQQGTTPPIAPTAPRVGLAAILLSN